jgi:hypothetical protein
MHYHSQSITAVFIVLQLLSAFNAEGQISHTSNIIYVAKDGLGFHSIQAALDSITDASEDNPYLVNVAPGVYEERVRLKDYVVIQGQGRRLTTIKFEGYYALKTVGSGPKELRSLTLECTGGRGGCLQALTALTVEDVTVRALGAKPVAIGHCDADLTLKDVSLEVLPHSAVGSCGGKGIATIRECTLPVAFNDLLLDDVSILFGDRVCSVGGIGIEPPMGNRNFRMSDSEIITKGEAGSIGILGTSGSTDLRNVRISAEHALRTSMGDVTVRYSDVVGSIETSLLPESEGIERLGPSVQLLHSRFSGQVSGQWGVIACFATCTDSMMPLDENCELIP